MSSCTVTHTITRRSFALLFSSLLGFAYHTWAIAQSNTLDIDTESSPASTTQPPLTSTVAPSPTAEQPALQQAITEILSRHHYRKVKLDSRFSAQVLAAYVESLDFTRALFLASDAASFDKYRDTLADDLKEGNVQPAYDIFALYLRRLAERTAKVHTLLQSEIRFDSDESLVIDRKNAPWAKTVAEQDDFWRKRIKNELLGLILSGKDQAAARELLHRRYENRLHQAQKSTPGDVFNYYMNAVAASFDPHTAYLSPRNTENFNIQMRLSLEGIGCVLRMEEELVTVVELVTGGPADLGQQIKAGDRIVAIAQGDDGPWQDIVGWRLDDAVDRIRGARGTVIRLKVQPGTASALAPEKTVRLVRDTIKLEKQAAKSDIKIIRTPEGRDVRVGLVTIPTFYSDFDGARRGDPNYRSTTRDVRRLLEDLRGKIDGLVLDVRDNGGGSLQEAVSLSALFIGDGPVVQVKNAGGQVEVEKDEASEEVAYTGPLAVLVDHASASASEIFAAALQDYGRGVIIGEPTFGKGTVQTLVDLNRFSKSKAPQGQLKLTIAKFYRVSGSSTQHRGVQPDISMPSTVDPEEVGESAQKNALPWDEIAATRYKNDPRMATWVPELARKHDNRSAKDTDYQAFLRDLDVNREQRAETTLSLLESKRRAQRDKIDTWQRERENRYRALKNRPLLKAGEPIPEGKESAIPDVVLNESAHIVADLAAVYRNPLSRTDAERP